MPSPTHNLTEYTVSELSGALKRTVEDAYGQVRVRGEMSGCKKATSGHCYFDLKDDKAVLNAVAWKGVAEKLKFAIENGLEVIATGKLTTYPGRSNYQLVVERMEPAGIGALMALLEQRKKQLEAEGLFHAGRKKPLPFMPRVIGVVTSPTGAVIRDILHRIADRFPVHVLVWPVRVQGEGSAVEIAAAIHGFNALELGGAIPRPDLLIVARGGGSLEDLWPFNEEIVVRAVADSDIPLISAVGHETDTTLIDFASDRRAPTPTAAAEMAVPVLIEWRYALEETQLRLKRALTGLLKHHEKHIEGLGRGLPKLDALLAQHRQRLDDLSEQLPARLRDVVTKRELLLGQYRTALSPARLARLVEEQRKDVADLAEKLAWAPRQLLSQREKEYADLAERFSRAPFDRLELLSATRLDDLTRRSQRGIELALSKRRDRLTVLSSQLQSFNHQDVLKRGYAYVTDTSGKPVMSQKAFPAGPADLHFADGNVRVQKVGGTMAAPPRPSTKRPVKMPAPGGPQGSLF